MKKLLIPLIFLFACNSTLAASHSVKGYTKKNGTHIAAHRQTNADKSKANNWSTKGNVNPYTGKKGRKKP